jgi:hypothetical protein
MPTQWFVDHKEGYLCIRWDDAEYDRPERVTCWYPAFRAHRADYAHLIGLPAQPVGGSGGRYTVRIGEGFSGHHVTVQLERGGNTQPIAFERTPIPCPKVRKGVETRYAHREWQKYLKTAGWVPA